MVIFWTLVFPLALATFFNLAFANLTASEEFETVKVALVEEQANSQFKETLQELEKGDDKLIDLQITSLDKAQQLLKDEKITGYYVVSNEIKLVVNNTGIDETILESIVNEYNSTMSTVENIATLNPSALQSNILNTVNLSKNNFENQNIGGNTDLTVVYFYTLDLEQLVKLKQIYLDKELELLYHRFQNSLRFYRESYLPLLFNFQ